MVEEEVTKEDEIPTFESSGFDIGGLEFDFFDTSLRRSYLEDTPSLLGSAADSGTSFPASPNTGSLFFRTDRGKFYIYDGTNWRQIIVALANGQTRMPGRSVIEK